MTFIVRLTACMTLEVVAKFYSTEGENHGWSQSGNQSHLSNKQRFHRKPVEAITGSKRDEYRFPRRSLDGILRLLIGILNLMFYVIHQCIHAFFDGGRFY